MAAGAGRRKGRAAVTEGPRVMAVVTLRKDHPPGGVPVFAADDERQRERIALLLAKILQGVVHDLENGDFIIVRH
ncbi:MAG: hypothetical protein DIU83_06125 [Bacillota bacterium]|nr:MAG: hypothetical protein DIU83_06125 [Bacillota bacterium]